MHVTREWLGAVLLVLAGTAARGQAPYRPLPASPQPSLVTAEILPLTGQVLAQLPHEVSARPAQSGALPSDGTVLSQPVGQKPHTTQAWLDYEMPACCGPIGGNGPVTYDVYFRYGLSFPVAGGVFDRTLNVGHQFFVGGRSLFFDQSRESAWVVDLGLFYMYNNANGNTPINFLTGFATVRALHRSGASFGLGRDWYDSVPGHDGDVSCNRSYGCDTGIRYGSTHVDLNVLDENLRYARLHDEFGQWFAGAHSNWEYPQGGWTLLLGLRGEVGYTWTDVLRTRSSSLWELSVLGTVGVRY